jgi:hypothetical protein
MPSIGRETGVAGISFHPASISGRAALIPGQFVFSLNQLEAFREDREYI